MPQIRCPRCGDPVQFGARDLSVRCGRCAHELSISGPAPEPAMKRRDKEQDSAISSAMRSIGLLILLVFSLPVIIGLWRGEDAPKAYCRIESEPAGAEIYEGQARLGQTPAELEQTGDTPRLLVLKKEGFLPTSLYLEPVPEGVCRQAVELVEQE